MTKVDKLKYGVIVFSIGWCTRGFTDFFFGHTWPWATVVMGGVLFIFSVWVAVAPSKKEGASRE